MFMVMVAEGNAMPEPPWSSVSDRRSRAKRRALTRAVIAEAAMRLVDADGLAALTMRRLAHDLDVVPASLYGHVSGRDEVLHLLLDQVAAETSPPRPDRRRWRAQCKDLLRDLRRAFLGHRDLAGAAIGNIPTGPYWMRMLDGLLGLLLAGRIPAATAAYASDLLLEIVISDSYEQAMFAQRLRADPGYFDALGAYVRELPTDQFPHVAALASHLTTGGHESSDDRFEYALDVVMTSLARPTSG